jgi:hypothetical protein
VPSGEKASHKSKAGTKRPNTGATLWVPKKVHFEKSCELCKKHGGAHTTHATKDCCKERWYVEGQFPCHKKTGKKPNPAKQSFSQLNKKLITTATDAIVGMYNEATYGNLRNIPNFDFHDHHLTIMHIADLPLGRIQEYLGMDNWENSITFAGVCKPWRIASKDHLEKIGITPMKGGRDRKLNVPGFLTYLNQDKFRFADTINVPCGKAEKLLYSEVKLKCPAMQKLIHYTWLKTDGNMENVQEGQSRHACYRMYKHDEPNIPGVNAWVKYQWGNKEKLVLEGQLVPLLTNRK